MSALVNYGSSDEDEAANGMISDGESYTQIEAPDHVEVRNPQSLGNDSSKSGLVQANLIASNGRSPDPAAQYPANNAASVIKQASNIPNTRLTMQDLTMPVFPNLDIPPSPPASPPANLDSKISTFLTLKKEKIHFNARLAASSALKNPSLLSRLIESAGLDERRDQYATTLPHALWNPDDLPEYASVEVLSKMQTDIAQKKEAERKGHQRSFVPAQAKDLTRGTKNGKSTAEGVALDLEGSMIHEEKGLKTRCHED